MWLFIILKCGSASLLPDIDGPLSVLKSIDSSVNVSVERITLKEVACKGFFLWCLFKNRFSPKFDLPNAECRLSVSAACMLLFIILFLSLLNGKMLVCYIYRETTVMYSLF